MNPQHGLEHQGTTRRPQGNTVKVGIKLEGLQPMSLMYELALTQPLKNSIQNVCDRFNIPAASQSEYCLYCEDTNVFLDETNLNELRDGFVLQLKQTPDIIINKAITQLKSNDEEAKKALTGLKNQIKNSTFANLFITRGGLPLLIKKVQETTGNLLSLSLQILQEVLDKTTTGWETIPDVAVQKIAEYTDNQNINVRKGALAIAERLVSSPSYGYSKVAPYLKLDSIISMLDTNTDIVIQSNSIALINSVLLNANPQAQHEFLVKVLSMNLRRTLMNLSRKSGGVSDDLAHQLYVFQFVWLNSAALKSKTPFSRSVPAHQELLNELQTKGSDSDSGAPSVPAGKKPNPNEGYARLGFESEPSVSLQGPTGLFALESMVYFARKYTETYQKIIIEQANRGAAQCPFAKASISLVQLLLEIFQFGSSPSEHSTEFYPVTFSTDYPFEEMYCCAIQLFIRTWKEMEANGNDFEKVLKVVRKQITTVLSLKQEMQPHTVDAFKNALFAVSYKVILSQQEHEMQEKESVHHQAEPVRQLRERLKVDFTKLVEKQRLSVLTDGAFFPKYSSKGRVKGSVWYCRLSPNHKVIHYGEAQEGKPPAIESLPNKVNISDVKALVIGKDSPLFTKLKKSDEETISLAFSLLLESSEEGLDFVAPNKNQYNLWTDGLRVLFKQQPYSSAFAADVESLLSMEMKLRLLHVEDVMIPAAAPPVPPPPTNYNFVCLSNQ